MYVKAKILIVDDQPEHLQLIMNLLKYADEQYELIVASNGEIAIKIAEKELPDLIIMDWDMPLLNGLEATKRIKNNNTTKDIPVVITTGVMLSPKDMRTAFEAGAIEFLRKPIESVELITRVRSMLQLSSKYKEVKEHKNELEKQNSELRDKNEELDAFSHTVAHDLKNPLNSMLGYLGMIHNEYKSLDPEKAVEYLSNIRNTAVNMAKIIDGLLLFSSVRKIDEIEIEIVDSKKIIENILSQNDADLKEKEADVVVHNIIKAAGHSMWIEEVWRNLICNAIKYGGNKLRIEIGSELKGNLVYYWIQDNGPGIKKKEQGLIFDQFKRVNKEKAEGYGLGLSIVSRIIKKLGGEIGIESEFKNGAKFHFSLPKI